MRREESPAVDDGQLSVFTTREFTLMPAQLVSMTESEYEEAVTALVELLMPLIEDRSRPFSGRQPSAA